MHHGRACIELNKDITGLLLLVFLCHKTTVCTFLGLLAYNDNTSPYNQNVQVLGSLYAHHVLLITNQNILY